MLRPEEYQLIRKALLEERQNLLDSLQNHDSSNEPVENGDEIDQANFLEYWEVESLLDQLSLQRMERINQALARLDNGTYGKCLKCGAEILPERLLAIPYAELCVNCQTRAERRGQNTRSALELEVT